MFGRNNILIKLISILSKDVAGALTILFVDSTLLMVLMLIFDGK